MFAILINQISLFQTFLNQHKMKRIGIIILVIGAGITLMTLFGFVTKEKVVDIGKLEITHNKRHGLDWSPIIGITVMAVGAGVYLLGKNK